MTSQTTPTEAPAEARTYAVRTDTLLRVQQALFIEQGNRQSDSGTRPRLMDIAAEWLEEKAATVISAKLKG